MSEMKIFKNNLFEVAAMLDNGEVLFDAEKVARCLGFTTVAKSGNVTIRWSRVNEYLGKSISQDVAKGDLIPEAAVYKLAFKASNETAEKFQDWLAIEVLPAIRRTGTYKIPLTKKEEMKLYLEVLEEQDAKIEAVNEDLQSFKLDMPLLGIECDRITTAVKATGVKCLGGKESPAYADNSLRSKIYSDIYAQVKREFGVSSYKAIKRNQTDVAIRIISKYEAPFVLKQEINQTNNQTKI